MKTINTYIIEKLKIDKESEVGKFNSIIDKLDEAWEKAGFDLSGNGDTLWLEKSVISNDKIVEYKHVDYSLFFKADKDSKPTLRICIFIIQENKNAPVETLLRFTYNNGKYAYSVSSNITRILKKEFELSNNFNKRKNRFGKEITYYECNDEVLSNLLHGINGLKLGKECFIDGISKIRFTQQQWNKLCEEIQYLFNTL